MIKINHIIYISFITAFSLLLLLLFYSSTSKNSYGKTSIEKILTEDAKIAFNSSKVEIIDIKKENNSTVVSLYISTDWDSKCPKRYKVTYYYPQRYFAKEIELVNKLCNPCDCPSDRCYILFPEEAVGATAKYGEGKVKSVKKENNIWIVEWENKNISITERCELVETSDNS